MKYSVDLVIDCPRDRVIELFDDPDNLVKWQPGLISFEPISGEPGQPGAKSRLRYQMGKREIEMIETVISRNLPDEFSGTYEAKNVWNSVENTFTELDDGKTRWTMHTEFKCKGFVRIMTWLYPSAFKNETRRTMTQFKEFAESA